MLETQHVALSTMRWANEEKKLQKNKKEAKIASCFWLLLVFIVVDDVVFAKIKAIDHLQSDLFEFVQQPWWLQRQQQQREKKEKSYAGFAAAEMCSKIVHQNVLHLVSSLVFVSILYVRKHKRAWKAFILWTSAVSWRSLSSFFNRNLIRLSFKSINRFARSLPFFEWFNSWIRSMNCANELQFIKRFFLLQSTRHATVLHYLPSHFLPGFLLFEFNVSVTFITCSIYYFHIQWMQIEGSVLFWGQTFLWFVHHLLLFRFFGQARRAGTSCYRKEWAERKALTLNIVRRFN